MAAPADIKDSILDTVGETPLVRLSRIAAGLKPQVVAKVEYFNPGGSIKDRVAMRMVEAAEADGRLKPGGTIVEPTSGNTGTGLAIAANPQTHYETTGPELWRQSGGAITHLVVGVGTGGTITGTGRYLKEQNPAIEIVGADPVGSIYSNEQVHPYLVEGVGEDFWPATYDPSIVDRYVRVSDRDSFLTTRRLAEQEGMLVGGSCGLAVYAALQVAGEITDPEAMVAVILPDGGRAYLSKIFNDAWMASHGMLERTSDRSVGDVLRANQAAGEF